MELKIYEKPQFIEELVFRIAPGQVERYLELEAELFSEPLSHRAGFLGGETWVSQDREGGSDLPLFLGERGGVPRPGSGLAGWPEGEDGAAHGRGRRFCPGGPRGRPPFPGAGYR